MSKQTNEQGVVSILFVVLIILVVAVAGAAVYNYHKSRSAVKVASNPSSTPKATPAPSPDSSPVAPALGSDTAMILTAASTQCDSSGGTNWGATLDQTPEIVGTAAEVGVHCTGYESGQVDILKKVNGTWTVINAGQQPPSKAIGEQYSLPVSWYQSN
jgi:hypothetical protein